MPPTPIRNRRGPNIKSTPFKPLLLSAHRSSPRRLGRILTTSIFEFFGNRLQPEVTIETISPDSTSLTWTICSDTVMGLLPTSRQAPNSKTRASRSSTSNSSGQFTATVPYIRLNPQNKSRTPTASTIIIKIRIAFNLNGTHQSRQAYISP